MHTWENVLQNLIHLRDIIIVYASNLADSFTTPIRNIIKESSIVLDDAIALVIPNLIKDMTLLEVMTSALVPVFLVIFIAKLFR